MYTVNHKLFVLFNGKGVPFFAENESNSILKAISLNAGCATLKWLGVSLFLSNLLDHRKFCIRIYVNQIVWDALTPSKFVDFILKTKYHLSTIGIHLASCSFILILEFSTNH